MCQRVSWVPHKLKCLLRGFFCYLFRLSDVGRQLMAARVMELRAPLERSNIIDRQVRLPPSIKSTSLYYLIYSKQISYL